MVIGDRLRELREQKKLSQGDIEKRTGLLRSYLSRVENGHTVPSVETLEKMARAMEVPLYQVFYDGERAKPLKLAGSGGDYGRDGSSNEQRIVTEFRKALSRISDRDQQLLLQMAHAMTKRKGRLSRSLRGEISGPS